MIRGLEIAWSEFCGSPLDVGLFVLDEAAATTEPAVIPPLALAPRRACFMGDPGQLPPNMGMPLRSATLQSVGRSLMERLLDAGSPFAILDTQYRMHPKICQLASSLFYMSLLKTSEVTAKAREGELETVVWVDVQGIESRDYGAMSWSNLAEAKLCVRIADAERRRREAQSISVMTGYAGQAALVREILPDNLRVDVETIDSAQGGEHDLVILSLVRSNLGRSIGFNGDKMRVNVALTRPRFKIYSPRHPHASSTSSRRLWPNF